MKKALPFIIIGIGIIVVVILLLRRKADIETRALVDSSGGGLPPDFEFPDINQNPDVATVIAPQNTAVTPPAVQGNLPIGPGCINNLIIVDLIDQWKRTGFFIKRVAIKNKLREMCPAALDYLVR